MTAQLNAATAKRNSNIKLYTAHWDKHNHYTVSFLPIMCRTLFEISPVAMYEQDPSLLIFLNMPINFQLQPDDTDSTFL
jgi:hypothetical protein